MYNVRNDQIEALLRQFSDKMRKAMPEGWGFTLMLFNYGEGGNMFYISNAERESMIQAMKEFIKRNEM